MLFRKLSLLLSAGLLLGLGVSLSARGEASFQQPAPRHVVVLLRNRNVIEGELVAEGDIYRIRVSQGEIFVPHREVLAVADSIKALYEHERSRLFGREAEPHLEMAIWCAEHGLEEEAWFELSQARLIDPRHPGLPLATRRVEMALLRKSQLSPSGKTRDESTRAQASRAAQNAEAGARGENDKLGLPQVPDPNALFRGLPPGTGEQFVRVILPIVNHSCASAGCHSKPDMNPQIRLLRVPTSRPPLRGEIAQNLQTVLGWVNFEHPGASPLLQVPLEPHGGSPVPLFSGTAMKQYRELVDWVYEVTRRQAPPPPPGESSDAEAATLTGGDLTGGGPSMPVAGAAGVSLDDAFPVLDFDVQQASHEIPVDAKAPRVVPATGSSPVSPVGARPAVAPATTNNNPAGKPLSFLSDRPLLQSNPEPMPGIRWTFGPLESCPPVGSGVLTPELSPASSKDH